MLDFNPYHDKLILDAHSSPLLDLHYIKSARGFIHPTQGTINILINMIIIIITITIAITFINITVTIIIAITIIIITLTITIITLAINIIIDVLRLFQRVSCESGYNSASPTLGLTGNMQLSNR